MVNALIGITLLQGSLNAAYEDDIDEGLTNKLCRLMKARAEEKKQLEEKVIEIAIATLESAANYLAPRRPPTLLERVSVAANKATGALTSLLENPL